MTRTHAHAHIITHDREMIDILTDVYIIIDSVLSWVGGTQTARNLSSLVVKITTLIKFFIVHLYSDNYYEALITVYTVVPAWLLCD